MMPEADLLHPYFCQIFLLQIIVFGLFVQRISFFDLFIFSCLMLLPTSEPGKLLGEFLIKKFPHRPGVPPAFNVILDRGNQLDYIHFFLSTYIKCFYDANLRIFENKCWALVGLNQSLLGRVMKMIAGYMNNSTLNKDDDDAW